MSRFQNPNWGMPARKDLPSGSSSGHPRHNPGVGRRDPTGVVRGAEELDGDGQPLIVTAGADPIVDKLDRILDKVDRMDLRLDEHDRCFDNLNQSPQPDLDYDDDEPEDLEFTEFRRERGARPRPPPPDSRVRGAHPRFRRGGPHIDDQPGYVPRHDRFEIDRYAEQPPRGIPRRQLTCWDSPVPRQDLPPPGLDHRRRHQPSCWDLPQHRAQYGMQGYDQQHRVKMDPPKFDGTDVTNWISRVEYYFDHIGMPDEHRLHYVVMLFEQPAAEWIFNYRANNSFVTWLEFLDDVKHRFDPRCFENYIGLISKLTQTGSVEDYQATFEKYMNQITGMPEVHLLPMFVAGLKQHIRKEVKRHRPPSLASAFALAIEAADTMDEKPPSTTAFNRRQWSGRDYKQPIIPPQNQQPGTSIAANPAKGASQPPRSDEPAKWPRIRVSAAEKAERSRRGECWYCYEKYSPTHVCKHKFLCYADEDNDGLEDTPNEDVQGEEVITADLSHLHTMEGGNRSKPLKVIGRLGNREVSVLIDTGSCRDFLHPRIAEELHLSLAAIKPFRVYVGNGASLLCTHVNSSNLTIVHIPSFALTPQFTQLLFNSHLL